MPGPEEALRRVSVKVLTGSDDEGWLLFAGEWLVAVIVRLDDPMHEGQVGSWFIETGFGPLAGVTEVFPSLDAALVWVGNRLQKWRPARFRDVRGARG